MEYTYDIISNLLSMKITEESVVTTCVFEIMEDLQVESQMVTNFYLQDIHK